MDKVIEELNIKINLIKARKKLYSLLYVIYFSINVGSLFILGNLPNAVIVMFLLVTWGFSKIMKIENNNLKEIKNEIKEQLDLINDIERKEENEEMVELVEEKVNNEEIINKYTGERLVINLAMINSIISASVANDSSYITSCEKQIKDQEEKVKQKVKK